MREKGIGEGITFDLEIEWTVLAKLRAKRLAQASALEVKDTLTDESIEDQNNPPPPPRRTMEDYCRRTDNEQVSLGFRPANQVNFDIKSNVLAGLRENQFNGKVNNDPDHLNRFLDNCQIQKVPDYITEDQKKLRLFAF
ncbi:hypothetical protein QL285_068359 [Trifolium repens]|jgi:hypothetical protein|nr:hypothetical protein QL285_068359 [Trifolium repens]